MQRGDESIVRVVTYTGTRASSKASTTCRHACGVHAAGEYHGRFVPDTEAKTDEELFGVQEGQSYGGSAAHLRDRDRDQLQGGRVALESSKPSSSPSTSATPTSSTCSVAKENPVQCADVKITTKRQHVRLVGRRHDVQLWGLTTTCQSTRTTANTRRNSRRTKCGSRT